MSLLVTYNSKIIKFRISCLVVLSCHPPTPRLTPYYSSHTQNTQNINWAISGILQIILIFLEVERICTSMPKVAKAANLQYPLRNDRLDCYDLLHADRPTLRCNLDSVVRLTRPTMFLCVAIHYLLVLFQGEMTL